MTTFNNKNGFTLIEVMIAVLISVFVIAGVMSTLSISGQGIHHSTGNVSREGLYKTMQTAFHNEVALTRTALANNKLKRCLKIAGVPKPNGKNCNSSQTIELEFFDHSGMQVGGTSKRPMYYDSWGNKCASQNTDTCAFQVTTEFQAYCKPEMDTLENAIPYPNCNVDFVEMIALTFNVAPRISDTLNVRKTYSQTVILHLKDLALDKASIP